MATRTGQRHRGTCFRQISPSKFNGTFEKARVREETPTGQVRLKSTLALDLFWQRNKSIGNTRNPAAQFTTETNQTELYNTRLTILFLNNSFKVCHT
jgi:hypothetical protein